jgi:GNAT superfamily N-acetyltransferase
MLGDTNLFLLDAASVASDYFGGVACSWGAAEVMVMVAEPAYRRRGYAQRAVQALLWYGATALRLRRFVAKVSEDNAPSLTLFTAKLGFTVAKRVAAFKEVHLVLEVGEPAAAAPRPAEAAARPVKFRALAATFHGATKAFAALATVAERPRASRAASLR